MNEVKTNFKFERDAAISKLTNGFIVHTCDSLGAVGLLKNDVLKVDVVQSVLYSLRVALMENISIGGKILSVSLAFANSPDYAERGMKAAFEFLKKWKVSVVISTEKNFPTSQTGIGVSVVGFTKKLRIGGATSNVGVYTLGTPAVGKEVMNSSVLTIDEFKRLLKFKSVGEVIPVGSKGIMAEARILAKNSGLTFHPLLDESWMTKSAGPATCIVFWATRPPRLSNVKKVGWLE